MKRFTLLLQFAYLRFSFWLLGQISPKRAAARANKLMSTPRLFPPKEREEVILSKAEKSMRPYRQGNIQLYRWGEGPKTILLVHGWEGRAGNFGGIIQRLLADGWSILAFDAPSHGQSDLQPTSMFDFAECLNSILQEETVDAIVAHSFGCVATTVILSLETKQPLEKLVMVASPNRFQDRLQQAIDLFGLSPKVVTQLRPMLLAQANYPIFDFSIGDLGTQLDVPERLLLHDKDDQVSLYVWSQQIAEQWSQDESTSTELITVEGTGHNRILWDADVINHIADFLADRA